VALRLRGDLLNRLKSQYSLGANQRAHELFTLREEEAAPTTPVGERLLPRLEAACRSGLISELDRALLLGQLLGYSARALAREHGLSHAAVRKRLSRARRYLREGRKARSRLP
jgi:DNA-directed RNA polymerase specialized sigma24 family protein